MRRILLLSLVFTAVWMAGNLMAGSSDGIVNEINVSPGQTLTLDLETGGDVIIRGWSKNVVALKADMSNDDDCCVFEMNQVPGGVRLHSRPKESMRSQSYTTSFRFEIHIPERFNIDLNSAGGDVNIARMNGKINGSTGGGEILIRESNGKVLLSTGGGEINIIHSHLDGDVSTGVGDIRFEGVTGDIDASTGLGNVIKN